MLERDIPTADPFQMPVMGADQQRPGTVERFGAAPQFPVADANGDFTAQSGAAVLPFLGQGVEIATGDAIVIVVELAENRASQARPIQRLATFYPQRRRHLS